MPQDYYRWNMNENLESNTSKYITGFLLKRKEAVRWMEQQLKNLECGEEIKMLSRQLLNRRTLIWTFYNECYKVPFTFKDFYREMSKAVKSELPHIDYRKLMKTNKSRRKYHSFLLEASFTYMRIFVYYFLVQT